MTTNTPQKTEKAVATVRYSEFKGKIFQIPCFGQNPTFYPNFHSDGHSTTTTKIEEEEAKNNTSLLSRALFVWFDKFVLTEKNREVNSKNLWTLDPEYRYEYIST